MRNGASNISLALRAGKLVYGDANVSEAVQEKRVRLICTAADVSEKVRERARRMPERSNGLYTELVFTQAELGAVVGVETCTVIAFLDEGLAWGFVQKLVVEDAARYQALLDELTMRHKRAQKRREKKHGTKKSLREITK